MDVVTAVENLRKVKAAETDVVVYEMNTLVKIKSITVLDHICNKVKTGPSLSCIPLHKKSPKTECAAIN